MPWLGISVGLLSESIFLTLLSSGLIPPCMHNIFYSMTAAMGMVLKQSMKVFQSLRLNFRLPKYLGLYTNHKIHRVCWFMRINGCLLIKRSFKGISAYNRREALLSRLTVCRDQRSLPGKGNSFREGNLRNRIFWAGLEIVHVCLPLSWWVLPVPGASVVIRRWFWRTGRPSWHRFLPFWHRFLSFRWLVCW